MCLAQGHNAVTQVRLEPTALGLEGSSMYILGLIPRNSTELAETVTIGICYDFQKCPVFCFYQLPLNLTTRCTLPDNGAYLTACGFIRS